MLRAMAKRLLPHPAYRVIRRRRIAREIASYTPRDHLGTYGDVALRLRFEDGLAEGWYGQDRVELPEITLLREIGAIRDGALVFDLGAHQGIVALELLNAVAPTGRVIAVEAEPHNFRMAEVNRELNVADRLTLVHAAVSDRVGTIGFAEGLNGHIDESTHIGNVEVPAVTIDHLCAQHGTPQLVVLDIEGHEGLALAQATRAMDAAFVVEVHVGILQGGFTPDDIVAWFDGWDRWIGGDAGFVRFDGRAPAEHFHLIAVPTR